MSEVEHVVGVALAGGESKRMGRDKTLLLWPPGAKDRAREAGPLWRHALDRLREATGEVLLADGGRGLADESVPDGTGRGPAAGILGAAAQRPEHPLLVLAVDLPWVPVALLDHLVDAAGSADADWIVPSLPRGLEPLCAVYRPAALSALRRRVESGAFDLHGLAEADSGVSVRRVETEMLNRFGDPERLFLNVNRPEDWAQMEALYAG